jgi:hypothetical protein
VAVPSINKPIHQGGFSFEESGLGLCGREAYQLTGPYRAESKKFFLEKFLTVI